MPQEQINSELSYLPSVSKDKFSEFEDGDNAYITFLVTSLETKTDVKGNDFLDIEATDGTSSYRLKFWQHNAENCGFSEGELVRAKVSAKMYKDRLSYSFNECAKDENASVDDYVLTPPLDIEAMWKWVENQIDEMSSPYREIATKLICDNGERYKTHAAGKSLHHAYRGGLLYHSFRMARTAKALSGLYGYNSDLAVCGCLLHDIGKLEELDTNFMGHTEYTVGGQIEGHMLIGIRMLDDAAKEMGISLMSEPVAMLRHIIASHHGRRDFGAIQVPMTKEAILVSQLDMMDMKLTVYDEQTESMRNGEITATEITVTDGRLYKPDLQ